MPIRIDKLEELAAQDGPLHLALGVFDGVHIGHQAVIKRAVDAAARDGGKSFIVTFSPHPIRVIAPEKAPASLLATLEGARRGWLVGDPFRYGLRQYAGGGIC